MKVKDVDDFEEVVQKLNVPWRHSRDDKFWKRPLATKGKWKRRFGWIILSIWMNFYIARETPRVKLPGVFSGGRRCLIR